MSKLTYTVKELISKLEDMPKSAKVELDCEGGIFEEMNIEQVGNRVVIFSQGESRW
jgi:hypothetical protein